MMGVKKFTMKVPCNGFDNPEWVEVTARKIAIPEFSGFEWVIHRRVARDLNNGKIFETKSDGWTVANYPTGCAVPGGSGHTQKDAIENALIAMRRAGARKIKDSFFEATRRLKVHEGKP